MALQEKKKKYTLQSNGALPFVTIQVPVYNEKFVIERLLNALKGIDYPKHKLEIQVLDDSTDETSALINKGCAALEAFNFDIHVIRRNNREGYKAGALAYGLQQCKGDLVAIFDADFLPPPNFLTDLIPHFNNGEVGMVQARWSHLNENENSLTRIQSFLLDTHFSIEQGGRKNADYFSNFCGTAGIWRKQCIIDAGGWDGSVLSEDLDLSYRAQLKGWKMVYDASMQVPAELPAAIEAFKIQQFRWTKGMAQIFRKTVSSVLRSNLPVSKKLHGIFHLLGSLVFVCLLINAVLTLPLLLYRSWDPQFVRLTEYALLSSLNLVSLTVIYYQGTRKDKGEGIKSFLKHYPLFLVVYMGLSVQNTMAVLQGLSGKKSPFVRTPKFSTVKSDGYLTKKLTWINFLEAVMLCYFLTGIGLSFYLGDYFLLLFFCMISYGLGFILYHTIIPLTPGLTLKAT